MHRTIIAIGAALLLYLAPANCTDKTPLTFQLRAMGQIEDKTATDAGFHTRSWTVAHFGFTVFRASNGNTLRVYYDDFNKPEEAKRFLDWKTNKSFRVLSQSTKTDAHGKPLKYRVVLIPDLDSSYIEVMWVVGTSIHWIDASTLEDAGGLEAQYRQ